MNFIELDSQDQALDNLIEECAEVIQACTKIKKFGMSNWHPITKRKNSAHLMDGLEGIGVAIKHMRKFISRPTDEEMVNVVIGWYNASPVRQQEEFITTDYDNLVVFMGALGQQIISFFNLWHYKWDKRIVDGVDVSTEHPEAVALRIIEQVWREVKDAS